LTCAQQKNIQWASCGRTRQSYTNQTHTAIDAWHLCYHQIVFRTKSHETAYQQHICAAHHSGENTTELGGA
jgi:hypothetical protein